MAEGIPSSSATSLSWQGVWSWLAPLTYQRGLIRFIEDHEVENSATVSNRLDNARYSIVHLLQRLDNMRIMTMIGLGLVIFHQFTGLPNVLFYSSTVFHSVGFESNASAVLASVGMEVVKVIATLVSMVFANRVGRRPLCSSVDVQSVLFTDKSQFQLYRADGRPHVWCHAGKRFADVNVVNRGLHGGGWFMVRTTNTIAFCRWQFECTATMRS
uniref:Uncharacterized protein n=1 Tax=Oncorhynchus mykiss TaxID=8022 RepID=A0A8C7Q1K1_ONCMY